jgi:hypothetical protein
VAQPRNRSRPRAWDIYRFYPLDAEWTDAGLPAPEKVIAQSMGVVIGAKGTLPPKGDQSRVPKWAEGRAVVGEQSELADLHTSSSCRSSRSTRRRRSRDRLIATQHRERGSTGRKEVFEGLLDEPIEQLAIGVIETRFRAVLRDES